MKTFFRTRKNGSWEIANGTSLSLKPEEGEASDFYRIADDLVMVQPDIIGTVKSVLGQSITPVVSHVPGESTLRCIGTGFFISCTGLFLTAAHVITDPIEAKYGDVSELDDLTWHAKRLNLGVMIPTNPLFQVPGFLFRPIEWAEFLAETGKSIAVQGHRPQACL